MLKKIFFILLFILFFLILFNINIFAFDFVGMDGSVYQNFVIPENIGDNFSIFRSNMGLYLLAFPGSDCFGSEDLLFRKSSNKFGYSVGELDNWGSISYYASTDGINWDFFYENHPDIPNASLLYSSDICYNMDWSVYYDKSFSFELIFFEEYNMYQIISYFPIDYDLIDRFTATISDGSDSFFLNWEFSDAENLTYSYYYDIYENGSYIVTINDSETDIDYTFTFNCTEIDESHNSLNLHLSTTEQTTEPIYVLSNRYYYEGEYNSADDFLNNYDLDVSYGYEETYGYAPLSVTGFDEERQMYYREYQFKIVVNGIYTFKILNFNTQEITYQTFNVDNIGIANKWGDDVFYDNYNDDGEFDPTPALFLEYVDTTTVRIRTQPFSFNEIIMLKCFTKFEDGDFSQNRNIYNYTTDTGNTIYDDDGIKQNNIDLYYFYLDVQVDGNYTFQFYNIELDKYTESSIDVDISEFIIGNIDNIDSFFDKMIAWSKLHFGFLVYPFELAIHIFRRVTNINFSDPVLTIPELKSPFDGTTFFSGVDFNFNSILDIGVVNTIYNIYLVVVDAILIFLFVSLCKKVFGEVFK